MMLMEVWAQSSSHGSVMSKPKCSSGLLFLAHMPCAHAHATVLAWWSNRFPQGACGRGARAQRWKHRVRRSENSDPRLYKHVAGTIPGGRTVDEKEANA